MALAEAERVVDPRELRPASLEHILNKAHRRRIQTPVIKKLSAIYSAYTKSLLILFGFLIFSSISFADNLSKATEALDVELKRSLQDLRLENSPPPYFIAYRLSLLDDYEFECSWGDVSSQEENSEQLAFVELRVGSYEMDNTRDGFATGRLRRSGALHFNTQTLRQIFWELTDTAYKEALKKYFEKKAQLAQELEEERLPDFSKEKPQVDLLPQESSAQSNKEHLRELCQQVSVEFNKYPELNFSEVNFYWSSEKRILLTSEGTRLLTETRYTPYGYHLHAEARAEDGLKVTSSRYGRGRTLSEIPSLEDLKSLARETAEEVVALKKAPLAQPELAPALLDGESTGTFFHEALGHRLEGHRQREKTELQTFKGKINQRIVPVFLSVISNPTLKSFKGVSLSGHFDFDSEGVKSERVVLVERGVLKNYLLSRRPISGFTNSNGNGRSDATHLASGRMGILSIETDQALGSQDLKARFLQEIRNSGKGFGFRLVHMRSGEAQTSRGSSQSFLGRPRLIFRVDESGQETLVRGLEYVGTPLVAIEKIVAVGGDPVANNAYCGSESGWVPVTEIAPSVVLSELELQREPEERLRPPIIKPPIILE